MSKRISHVGLAAVLAVLVAVTLAGLLAGQQKSEPSVWATPISAE